MLNETCDEGFRVTDVLLYAFLTSGWVTVTDQLHTPDT